ncbi:MAG: hypothetical protein HY567_03940 [Candidatus Kerfeldbacteria bacterium]|nr:hypothetical protein [Candidatus Kerfeldbacteria bacterium]
MDGPPKNNFLQQYVTHSNIGVIFIFVAILGLGLTLLATGALALVEYNRDRATSTRRQPLTVTALSSAVSNEKANPGPIAFYLNRRFAGGLLEDGTFSPPNETPPAGPLAILMLNPAETTLPTTVQFASQSIIIDTPSGATTVCLPQTTGGKAVWVAKDGSTYLDAALKLRLRSC